MVNYGSELMSTKELRSLNGLPAMLSGGRRGCFQQGEARSNTKNSTQGGRPTMPVKILFPSNCLDWRCQVWSWKNTWENIAQKFLHLQSCSGLDTRGHLHENKTQEGGFANCVKDWAEAPIQLRLRCVLGVCLLQNSRGNMIFKVIDFNRIWKRGIWGGH